MNVTRNWVDSEHFRQFLSIEPATISLIVAYLVVASVASSFWLLGVKVYQSLMPNISLP
jgi:hypothetical protein